MSVIDLARAVAITAHVGQTDKAGDPYWHHPEAVAALVSKRARDANEAIILVTAAWLHDVLEDTDLTSEDLRTIGIPMASIVVVETVSRRDGEPYDVFIERIAQNVHASKLKDADLEHNLDPTRRWQPGNSHRQRYLDARSRLAEVIS